MATANTSSTILQLTDCHLLADRNTQHKGWNTLQMLEETLQLAQQETGIDLILLTGDLSQDASAASYHNLCAVFKDFTAPIYALPGNHDDFNKMQQLMPAQGIRCDKRIQLDHWQILLLDSTCPNEVAGQLSHKELDWLEQCLNQSDNPTLLALHHPPISLNSAWMDQISLQNAGELMTLIQAHPQVKGVIFGHAHQAVDIQQAQTVFLGTPSTCYQFMPACEKFQLDDKASGYRLLELHSDGRLDTKIKRIG